MLLKECPSNNSYNLYPMALNLMKFAVVFLRYVIVENLRYMLSSYNSSVPMYFGHKFKPFVRQGFFSGGAGKYEPQTLSWMYSIFITINNLAAISIGRIRSE